MYYILGCGKIGYSLVSIHWYVIVCLKTVNGDKIVVDCVM